MTSRVAEGTARVTDPSAKPEIAPHTGQVPCPAPGRLLQIMGAQNQPQVSVRELRPKPVDIRRQQGDARLSGAPEVSEDVAVEVDRVNGGRAPKTTCVVDAYL